MAFLKTSDDEEYVSVPKDEPLMPDLVGQTPDSSFGIGSNSDNQPPVVSDFGDNTSSAEQTPTEHKMPVDLLSNDISEIPETGVSDSYQQKPMNLGAEPAQPTAADGLLLDFGVPTQSEKSNTQPSIQEQDEEDFKDDQTPIQEPEYTHFMEREATPPPSPPPSPVQTTEHIVEEEPSIPSTPPTEQKPMAADTTTPSSEDRPVRMPKATTISPPSKAVSSRAAPNVSSGSWLKELHPQVWELILWRNPVTTGCVLGFLLFVLLSLTTFSVFSVVSYSLLLTIIGSLLTRLVKYVLAKVHHGDESHPFKVALEADLSVDENQAEEYARHAVEMVNTCVTVARDLIFIKEFIASIKFGVILYATTYVGAWFNGLTVLILAVVGVFTIPKIYEVNKVQIDKYVEMGMTKFHDVYKQLQAKVPFLKQKQQ